MSCKTKNLVFMDSGIGGIPYLRWVRQKRPDWNYIYLADNGYFPYGGRTPGELEKRLLTLTELLIGRYSPDIIVLACNTASVTALSALRSRFDIPFVGVVPAVKPAAEKPGSGRIGVLATRGTVEGSYLKDLIGKFVPDRESVDCIAASDLVQFVENRLATAPESEIKEVLLPYLLEAEKREWSYMVLGCTHYIFLKPWLEKWKSSALTVIDSTEGVGKRILSLLEDSDAPDSRDKSSRRETASFFHITDDSVSLDLYRNLAHEEKMELKTLEAVVL